MTKSEFLQNINQDHKKLIEKLMPIIEKYDSSLKQSVVKLMGTDMLGYKQDGEFKYAFASYLKHLSFHNMVMYCYPELNKKYKKLFKGTKFQKSCINFPSVDNFPFDAFEGFIKESSSYRYPSELQLKNRQK